MLPPSKNISTATVGIFIVLVIGIVVKQGHVIAVMVAIVAAMVVIVSAMVVIVVAMVVIAIAIIIIVSGHSWLRVWVIGRVVVARWEVVMGVIEVWPWSVEFFLVVVAVQSWCVFIVGPQG